MKKRNVVMLAAALVLGMTVIGCGEEESSSNPNPGPYTPPEKTPLTGTVTVTDDITVPYGGEIMKLTADVSGLNGTNSNYYYQWMKDGANISGATQSSYTVTEADYGKTIRVKVTYYNYSGEQFGEFTVPNPAKLVLTLKWDNAAGKKDTGITIERENEGYWKDANTVGNLTVAGTTLTLTSWKETKFKMRTTYTLIETRYYFKKDNASGSELFDFTNGTKTYTLTNTDVGGIGMKDLFATEE